MMTDQILGVLKQAIVSLKTDETKTLAEQALDQGTGAIEMLNRALVPALEEVGGLFRDGDYFLPDVLLAVKAYNNAYVLIEPRLKESGHQAKGTIMLGTVAGDIHEIGKNILLALLQGQGFRVVDLGVDVKPETFLAKAREVQPHIIGMSALLTITMTAMKETIDLFKAEGLRDRYKFIVGGAPVSQSFAREIGADGYGQDAQVGVELALGLLK
ncbi:MAG: corrinoid protein [Thermodesulfobacteriota bacterium]